MLLVGSDPVAYDGFYNVIANPLLWFIQHYLWDLSNAPDIRQAEFDADLITVETAGSRVTLRGTVQSIAERRAAERAVWNAPGVTHVDDEMVIVTPQPLLM